MKLDVSRQISEKMLK